MTPEQESVFREKLKALSPAELEMLRDMAQASIMRAHKVTDVDGRKVGTHVGKHVKRTTNSLIGPYASSRAASLMYSLEGTVDRLKNPLGCSQH